VDGNVPVLVYFVTVTELKFHHIPVEEFDSPSLLQMHQINRILRQAQEKHEVFYVNVKHAAFMQCPVSM